MVTTPCVFSTPFFSLRFFRKRFRIPLGYSISHLLVHNLEKNVAPRESVYQKMKCLGNGYHPLDLISNTRQKQISKATLMFPRSSYPMKLTGMRHDQTGSSTSKMAVSKPDVPISQPVDMIGTRF